MDQFKEQMGTLLQTVRRIDDRGESHTATLERIMDNMQSLHTIADSTERMASSIESISLRAFGALENKNKFDWRFTLVVTAILGIIAGILVLGYTGANLHVSHSQNGSEVTVGK